MAKNKKKPTKETIKMDQSDEKLTKVDVKPDKKSKQEKIAQKKIKDRKKKNDKPKRNRIKEIISELKKVNWPTFKKACKQTGTVLVVVGVFMLAVFGIDSLVSLIIKLIAKI